MAIILSDADIVRIPILLFNCSTVTYSQRNFFYRKRRIISLSYRVKLIVLVDERYSLDEVCPSMIIIIRHFGNNIEHQT